MPNIITNYVKWVHSQGGVRGHGAGSGFAPFEMGSTLPEPVGYGLPIQLLPGDSVPDPNDASITLYLAFCSVTNSQDGSLLIFPGDGVQIATVGNTDMNVNYVYVPIGGGGGGPTVFIDAFDADAGAFSNVVHIVDVSIPALSNGANQDGVVPTASAVHLEAVNPLSGVPFDKWRVIWAKPGHSPSIDGGDPRGLSIHQNDIAVCFTFYYSKSGGINIPRLTGPAIWHNASYAEMVDGDPHYPMNPEMSAFAAVSIIAGLATKLDAPARSSILQAMSKQVVATAKQMADKLNGMAKGE